MLKYDVVSKNRIDEIRSQYGNDPIVSYIKELYDLIEYQRLDIVELNKQLVALKHKISWKHYDRPLDQYDTVNRRYIDKPPKSDNMSC